MLKEEEEVTRCDITILLNLKMLSIISQIALQQLVTTADVHGSDWR